MTPTLLKLFDDPTEGKIVNNRLFNGIFPIVQEAQLDNEDRKKLIHLLVLICKKLIGVRGHIDRFNSHLAKETSRVLNPEEARAYVNLSDDLFLEFDGFLVQIKSTLDHLVKAPTYIVGKRYWNLSTFGEKGAKVTSALGNLPTDLRKRAQGFNDLLILRNQAWLQDTIKARDKINHFLDGGIDSGLFCVTQNSAGSITVPMWSPDQPIAEFMEAVWANIFRFCEDFLAIFLGLKLPTEITVVHDLDNFPDPTSPWKVVVKEAFERQMQEQGLVTAPLAGRPSQS